MEQRDAKSVAGLLVIDGILWAFSFFSFLAAVSGGLIVNLLFSLAVLEIFVIIALNVLSMKTLALQAAKLLAGLLMISSLLSVNALGMFINVPLLWLLIKTEPKQVATETKN